MFDNMIDPIQSSHDISLSHHFLSNSFNYDTICSRTSFFCLVLIASMFLGYYTLSFLVKIRTKYIVGKELHFIKHKLPNYFSALKKNDCEQFLEDE